MNGRRPLYLVSAGCTLLAGILFPVLIAPDEAGFSAIQAQAAQRPGKAPAPSRLARDDAEARASAGLGGSRLTGIVIGPDHPMAIFAGPGAEPLVVSEGDNVSGWRVDRITSEKVVVTGPEGTTTLRPKPDPALAGPAQAVQQAAAGTVPSGPPPEETPRGPYPIPPGIRSAVVPPGFPHPGVGMPADTSPDVSTEAEEPPGLLYPGVVWGAATGGHSRLARVPRLRADRRLGLRLGGHAFRLFRPTSGRR
jgi:hypothetical protein